jgi:hypothetical protein
MREDLGEEMLGGGPVGCGAHAWIVGNIIGRRVGKEEAGKAEGAFNVVDAHPVLE